MFINYFCLAFDWFLTIRRVRVAMMQSCNVDRVAATVLVWASPPLEIYHNYHNCDGCVKKQRCISLNF